MHPPQQASAAEYTHLGAYFKSLREHYELDVQQVAARLHIRGKYIEAIEAGDMGLLPGAVYTQGYIHSYAEFLGLDPASVMAQYEGLSKGSGQPKPFRLVGPTEQAGIPAWRYIALAMAVILLLYLLVDWLSSPSAQPLERRIQPVPERIAKKAATPLLLTPQNEMCLSLAPHSSPLPCYYLGPQTAEPELFSNPLRSVMEQQR